ncbi:MAG: carboxypeptidase-like regulatory domain-containing protein, partial [Pyrinomonadaceae bacterium]
MIKNFRYISLVLSIMLCFAAVAFGQETTGNIAVTVKDTAGAVVPNVSVTVNSAGSTVQFERTSSTDSDGVVRFEQIPPGLYSVTTAASGGFGTRTIDNVQVLLDKTAPVNVEI